jgi:predicted butyrate kinase (DUF1464 family)
MRVVGIDPGTISIDICGLDDGRVFLDRTLPTATALADPATLGGILDAAAPLDLVAGPSGYGLPLMRVQDATDEDLRLAYLAGEGEPGGIGGLRRLMRSLANGTLPVMLTPGVVHLASVPAYRKINRVDMGTADKVCAAALAIHERARERKRAPGDVSLILLELGGAFTAALAVARGRIVDGVGGTSGPLGARAAGALDGEVAFLAGSVSKAMLFRGGVADVASAPDQEAMGWQALVEGAVKAAAALKVAAPEADEVVLSGRHSRNAPVRDAIAALVKDALAMPVVVLSGFAESAGEAAQGAALLADGLAGGASAAIVDAMGIRDAAGSVLDHLHVVTPAAARARLGIA